MISRTAVPERQWQMQTSDMVQAKVAVKCLFNSLDARFRDATSIHTGIAMLDRTGGLHAGEIMVLAGHPGVGKTSLAISVARHAAMHDAAVLSVSLAETTVQTAERFVLQESGVRPLPLRTGTLQRQDMTALTYAAAAVSKWRLQIEDTAALTAATIRECARRWRESEPADHALIVVDYLQLLADDCDTAAVLSSLLGTAKETRSALLLVSQHLADARERATVQSIATAVVYLCADIHTHEIVLAKHRYCQTPQTEQVVFDGSTFASVPPAEAETGT
ncbi:MAG: DnaB-like helicase C-terminal domain-containing protein [Deltaproteobacteria bacterium]